MLLSFSALQHLSAKVLFWVVLLQLTGCMSIQTGKPLVPAGPFDDGPMVIRKVFQDTPASNTIQTGDKILRLDDTPINSIGEYYKLVSSNKYSTVTIQKQNSSTITVDIGNLLAQDSYKSYASPLDDGESFVVRQTNADGEPRLAGLISAGHLFGTVSGTFWEKSYNIIEVRLTASVPSSCKECTLKNIALMDWNAQSWLQPISQEDAAWLIYPPLNQPSQMVNVPPPVPIGTTALSSTVGTFDANRYGNYIYGSYSGRTMSTIVPQYDYTLTNLAIMQNLTATIQRDNIQQQNQLRQDFVSKRSGNLRIGKLNSGEKIMGHVYFAVPKNLTGPYVVFVDGGSRDSVGAVRLNIHSQ